MVHNHGKFCQIIVELSHGNESVEEQHEEEAEETEAKTIHGET